MNILKNPTESATLELLESAPNLIKTIFDTSGNLYCWDGDEHDHQDVMIFYSIPQSLYETASRIYVDFGGTQAVHDVLLEWNSTIKGKHYSDGVWLD